MTITMEEYRQKLALKLVNKFVNDLYEKTGMKATVQVDRLKIDDDTKEKVRKIISLDLYEKIFLKALPIDIEINPISERSRKRQYVDIRAIFSHIATKKLKFTTVAVGRFMGRDHTTIIHLNKKAENMLDTDESFVWLYNTIFKNLNTDDVKDVPKHSDAGSIAQ
jgi:hypothetical protein